MGWIRKQFLLLAMALVLCLTHSVVFAQTASEWFSQKKTQQEYLLEQLVALKMYAGYAKKGYQIGKEGLGFIQKASRGSFDLDQLFFYSLKSVSNAVKADARVSEIMEMQESITDLLNNMKGNQDLNNAQTEYINRVRKNLNVACTADLDELLLILSPGRLEMGEGQRLSRLEKIYRSMLDKHHFAVFFYGTVQEIGKGKRATLDELKKMGGLYEK